MEKDIGLDLITAISNPGLVKQTTTAFNVADFVFSGHYQPEAFCRDCLLYCIDTYNHPSQQQHILSSPTTTTIIIVSHNEISHNYHISQLFAHITFPQQQLTLSYYHTTKYHTTIMGPQTMYVRTGQVCKGFFCISVFH